MVNFWSEGTEEEGADGGEGENASDGKEEFNIERYPFLHYSSPGPTPVVRSGTVSSEQAGSFYDMLAAESTRTESAPDSALLLVCTHGARDCRCGDTGGALIRALRAELKARQASGDPDGLWNKIKLGEVAHVGGHKCVTSLYLMINFLCPF